MVPVGRPRLIAHRGHSSRSFCDRTGTQTAAGCSYFCTQAGTASSPLVSYCVLLGLRMRDPCVIGIVFTLPTIRRDYRSVLFVLRIVQDR